MPYILPERMRDYDSLVDLAANSVNSLSDPLVKKIRSVRDVTSILSTNLIDELDVSPGVLDVIKKLSDRRSFCTIGGDLNFCVFRYLIKAFEMDSSPRYETGVQCIKEVCYRVEKKLERDLTYPASEIAIIRCVDHEIERRFSGPYEDKKMSINGDAIY